MTASTEHSATASRATETEQAQRVLRRAAVVWRRAGVRPAARAELSAELEAELQVVHQDGAPLSAVVGNDADATLRAWAQERGLSGRSLRARILVPTTLAGVLLGAATLIAQLVADFAPMVTTINPSTIPGGLVLTIWASSAVMSVLVPVLACWAVLQAGRDPHAGITARWLMLTVPLGEAAALGLGIASAAALDFTYDAFPVVIAVVLATMACSVLLGRKVAIGRAVAAASATGSSTDSAW